MKVQKEIMECIMKFPYLNLHLYNFLNRLFLKKDNKIK